MDNNTSAVEKVVNDFLIRVKDRIGPDATGDKERFMTDLKGRIEALYNEEQTGDEIDRILNVIRKIGEPEQVAASFRKPEGKSEQTTSRSPLFWVLMIFLGLVFGLPVAMGALGALIGLCAGLIGILVGYVAVGVGLTFGGLATLVVSFLVLFAPDALIAINAFFDMEMVHYGMFNFSPFIGGIIGMVAGGVMTGIGGLILFSTRYIFKAVVSLVEKLASFLNRLFKRRSTAT